jgi:hypothetical protein
MFDKLSDVICINTRRESESRRLTLFDFLSVRDISYRYVEPRLNTRDTSLGKRLAGRHYLIPHLLSILDSCTILLHILPHLALFNLYSSNKRRITVIVCFNSWYIYPIAFLLSFIPKVQVVVDLGYPIDDISTTGLPHNFKLIIGFLERLLYVRPFRILVESEQQKSRLCSKYHIPKFYVFYVLSSFGLSANCQSKASLSEGIHPSISDYILFRGTLNRESGICRVVEDFIAFKKVNPASTIKLYINGRGEYASYLLEKAGKSDDIVFDSSYLDNDSLTNLMVQSTAMIGQFGTCDKRLDYTIPHKFIEAVKLRKLYLSPLSLPIEDYYRLLLEPSEIELLRKSDSPLLYWLTLLCDVNRIPSGSQLINASKLVETDLTLVNHSSLSRCIL